MTTPSLQDEVAFIANVSSDGTLAQKSFYSWAQNTPATYSSSWTRARKWGSSTAGTSGGTVSYYFDPNSNWSSTEKSWFAAGLALWSAVSNIKFTQTTSATSAGISFKRVNDGGSYTYAIYMPSTGACVPGGTVLGTMINSSINIDTTGTVFGPISGLASQGGFTIENLLHEEGHALGLGHAGPYDGSLNVKTQQYSAYDSRQYSVMSYIDPNSTGAKYYADNPAKANYGGNAPTTPMMADILAAQRLYGAPTTTPLDGGEVFGFNSNISGAIRPFFDFTQNKKPVITIWDKGTGNSLDLSGFTDKATVNLNAGAFSSTSGLTNNIAIAQGTRIDRLVCTAGGTSVTCNNNGDTVVGGIGADTIRGGTGNDTLNGGAGNDQISGGIGTNTINGGAGTDTAVYSGTYSAYKVVKNADGSVTVTQSGLKDVLTAMEVLKFSDMSLSASTLKVLASGTLDASGLGASALEPDGANTAIGWDDTALGGAIASAPLPDTSSSALTNQMGYSDIVDSPALANNPLSLSDTSGRTTPFAMPMGLSSHAMLANGLQKSWHAAAA